ncbi:hypothetical protein Neosp_006456 [[Neocosmospora] mangrovei]
MTSPESPSRFIYERNRSMSKQTDDNTDLNSYLSSTQPSEDWPDSPEYYDRFSPSQHHDYGPFADAIPREAHMVGGPDSRDVTPYDQSSERDDTNTVTSLSSDDGVPEHVAHALNDPEFRCFAARQVHDICLGISQDFIENFRYNIEQRLSEVQQNESRRFPDHSIEPLQEHTRYGFFDNQHNRDLLYPLGQGECVADAITRIGV